jgi:CRP-like cAMP-binding protein
MTGQLIEYIKKSFLQTDIDKVEIDRYFQIKTLKKNETLLSLNSICRNYYFVNKGVLRVYFIHEGEEHTSWFAFENYFFTELESYINETFSNYCIKAVEDCEILEISKSNINTVFSKYKWWQEFLLFTQQQTILKLIETIKSFQTLSANDRYQDLFKHPDFLQRTTQKDLAKMLGITKHTLSRLRKNKQ